jgi:hypothetical protein
MAIKGNPVPTTVYQQGYFKVSDGKSVRVTVPASSEYKAGELALISGFLGFLTRDVKTGVGETADAILTIEQAEYETDQTTEEEVLAVGDLIYWNPTTKKVTKEADDGEDEPTAYRLVGRVTSPVDAKGVIWFILGPQV